MQHQHRSRNIQCTLWHHEICTCSGKCRYGFAPCSSSLLVLLLTIISAHENINPRGETLKLETRDSTKHSLGPTKRSKQQTMNLELWSKPLLLFLPLGTSGRSPKPYKLGIGRCRFGYRWVLPLNLQNMQSTAAPENSAKTLSETDALSSSSEHGLYIGGIGFGWSPIGYAGFMSCFKVQGNFLLLCSSSNLVGYSYYYSHEVPL